VETSYENITGFVAANFLTITFNGVFVSDITEIPIIEDGTDAATDDTTDTTEDTDDTGA